MILSVLYEYMVRMQVTVLIVSCVLFLKEKDVSTPA